MAKAVMTTAELHCLICPSKPNFSDQSHLLTHIGSKGHLSHYFKAQVKSREDEGIRVRLHEYDAWYKRNAIEELLSHRLRAKDNKTSSRKNRTTEHNHPATLTPAPRKRNARKKFAKEPQQDKEYDLRTVPFFDPGRGPHQLLPVPGPMQVATAHTACQENDRLAPIARMRTAPNSGLDRDFIRNHSQEEMEVPDPADAHNSSEERQSDKPYPLSSTGLKTRLKSPVSYVESSLEMANQGDHTSTKKAEKSKVYKPDYAPGDPAILKGVRYPGMDLFDTADIESRRKRNQKKDAAILAQMEFESQAIEPTETIYFSTSFDFKKARFISGEVESSPSPELEEEAASDNTSRRSALADKDPNTRRAKKSQVRKTVPFILASHKADLEYDNELELTAGRGFGRGGRSFSVFEDSSMKAESSQDSQGTMPHLTAAFNPEQPNNAQQMDQCIERMYQPQPINTYQASFLEDGLFDRPSWEVSDIRTNVFAVDGQFEDDTILNSQYHGMPNTTHANQRYFTTNFHSGTHFHQAAPEQIDIAIAESTQLNINPILSNNAGSCEPFNPHNGSSNQQHLYQETPLDFRFSPRYTIHEDFRIPGSSSSSETTIDQGLEAYKSCDKA